MRRFALNNLRLRLSLFVLISLIPALAILLVQAREERARLTIRVQEQALQLARQASLDHEQLITAAQQLLGVVAQLPEVRGGDMAACGAFSANLLKQYPQYANFGLITPDGNLACSGLPFTGRVYAGDRMYFARAVATRQFAVGEYQVGRVTGKATVNFGYPVFSTGRLQGVVFAALDLSWLNQFAAHVRLPEGSTLTVIDRQGTILARFPDPQAWVGKSVPEAPILTAIASQEGEGTAEAVGLDGTPRLYGFTLLGRGPQGRDIYVSIGIPQHVAYAEVYRSFAGDVARLLTFGVLALVAAWVGATRLVLRPVDALTAASQRLRAGDLTARTKITRGPTEITDLAQTLDEMAASLQQRLAERETAEAQILSQLETLTGLYNAAQKLSQTLDVQTLASDITRGCVTFGASLAWLWRAESDGSVRPMSHFPVDVDHVQPVIVRWDESPQGHGVAGRSIRTGFPVVIDGVATDPGFAPWREAALARGICSAGGFPLIARDKPFGVLTLYSSVPGFFTPKRVEFFQAYANLAAAALENARLFEETDRHVQRLQALRTIDVAITSSLDLRVTLDVLLDQVATQLKVDAADVLLLNPHTQTLEYVAGRGFRAGTVRGTHLRLGEGYAGHAAMERRTLSIPNLAEAPEFPRPAILQEEGFVSYLVTPLIAKGQVKGILEVFSRSATDPAPSWVEFLETLGSQAAIAIDNAALFSDLERANVGLTLAYETTLEGWSRALDLRDKETEGHTQRVTELTVRLARTMGMSEEALAHVRRGALLHDIGKMGIPDSILLKPGPLTDEEWTIMKKHPVYALELLSPIAYLRPALDIPYCHHEKWDGTGYPRGLKGEQIPLAARIFAVVDVWDALRSDRPYRPAWPADRALDYIRDQAGKHFDSAVVDVFLRMVETFDQDQLDRT